MKTFLIALRFFKQKMNFFSKGHIGCNDKALSRISNHGWVYECHKMQKNLCNLFLKKSEAVIILFPWN